MLSADDTPTPLSPAAESDQHKLLRGATSSTTTTPFKAPPQFRRADSSILAQRKRGCERDFSQWEPEPQLGCRRGDGGGSGNPLAGGGCCGT